MLEILRNPQNKQARLTLFGTILIKLATGLITVWGGSNIYFLSYFKQKGEEITASTNSYILLAIVLPMSLVVLIATFLSNKFGYQKVIKICAVVFFLSPWMIHYQFTILTLVVFVLLIPVSAFAISSIPVVNCLWTQFPTAMNLSTSIAVTCFGIGGVLWNVLFMFLNNPYNKKAQISQQGMAFFDSEVNSRTLMTTSIIFGVSGLMFITGSWMVSKRSKQQIQIPENQIELKQYSPQILEIPNEQQTLRRTSKSLKSTLKSKKFIIIFTASFFMGIYQIYLTTNLKLIYMPIINDDHFLAFCMVIHTTVGIFAAILWGYIGDHKKFAISFLIIAILDCFAKFYGIFAQTKTGLIVMFSLLGLADKGMLTVVGPGLVQYFGIEMATSLLPFKGLSIFLGFVFIPLVQILTANIFTSTHQLLSFLFIFSLIGLLQSVYFKVKYPKSLY